MPRLSTHFKITNQMAASACSKVLPIETFNMDKGTSPFQLRVMSGNKLASLGNILATRMNPLTFRLQQVCIRQKTLSKM